MKNFEKFNFCGLLRIPEIHFNRFSFLGSVKLYPLPFVIRPKMFIKRGIKKSKFEEVAKKGIRNAMHIRHP